MRRLAALVEMLQFTVNLSAVAASA